MSPRARQVLSVIFGFLLVAVVGYGVFVAARVAVRFLASVNSVVAVAVITAAATVLVSILSIVLGKVYESRLLIQKEHREKKIPVYEELIKFMFRIVMGAKTGGPPTETEMVQFMSDFTQRIMVWGSDEVLAAWVKWRRLLTNETAMKASPMQPMFLYEELILAIRRDLGHRNRALVKGDILALFVNDIDQYLPKKRI